MKTGDFPSVKAAKLVAVAQMEHYKTMMNTPNPADERDELLRNCDELESAIFEVLEGKRKPGKLPVEPMSRLIQYARTGTIRNATLKNPASRGES